MAHFVELEDGSLVNLDHVIKLYPNSRSNRLDYTDGSHQQLTDVDAKKVREAVIPFWPSESKNDKPQPKSVPRRRGRPKKYVEPEQ